MKTNDFKVNKSNVYYKKLKSYFNNKTVRNPISISLGKWNKVPRNFVDKLIINGEELINKGEFVLNNFLNEKEVEYFLEHNNKRVNDERTCVHSVFFDDIKSLLVNYYDEEFNPNTDIVEAADKDYVDFLPFNDDFSKVIYLDDIRGEVNDIIVPKDSTSFHKSVLTNLFFNNKFNYSFNESLDLAGSVTDAFFVKRGVFKINNFNSMHRVITKYEVICRSKLKSGGECGRTVHFNTNHDFNTLKCNHNVNYYSKDDDFKAHTLKNLKDAFGKEFRDFYSYNGQFIDESGDGKDITILSMVKLEKSMVNTNFVFVNKKGNDSFVVILSYEFTKKDLIAEGKIINNDDESFVLKGLFESIKNYYKNYHKVIVNNSNQVVSWVSIGMCLCNFFYGSRYNMLTIGESGSGKSFITRDIILPLFSSNMSTLFGSSVSESRFLGGRDINPINNSFVSSRGLIEVCDNIVVEEVAEALNNFNDPKQVMMKKDNIFTMLKLAEDGGDRGKRGSMPIKPKSNLFMLGNYEDITIVKSEYLRRVKAKYAKIDGDVKPWKDNINPYKPYTYYSEKLNNEALGSSHVEIRETREFLGKHFVTGLNVANQSRIPFMFLIMQDDSKDNNGFSYTGDKKGIVHHSSQFQEELREVFKDLSKPSDDFMRSVHGKLNDYLFKSGDGWNLSKGFIKPKLFEELVRFFSEVLWLDKIWKGKPYSKKFRGYKFGEDDALFIEYLMCFNYNTLSLDEASMKVKPTPLFSKRYSDVAESNSLREGEFFDSLKKAKDSADELSIPFDDEEGGVVKSLDDEFFDELKSNGYEFSNEEDK